MVADWSDMLVEAVDFHIIRVVASFQAILEEEVDLQGSNLVEEDTRPVAVAEVSSPTSKPFIVTN